MSKVSPDKVTSGKITPEKVALEKITPEKTADTAAAMKTQFNRDSTPPSAEQGKPSKPDDRAQPKRVISDPNEVAQLVMMRIDHVNAQKDELTTAVKALADTAKQLVGVYAKQQTQIARLDKRVQELEKAKD